MKLLNNLKLVLGGVAVASLAACGGGGGGSTAETGTLRLALTDAPACGYNAVNVTILKVRVHQSSSASESDGGWSEIELKEPLRVDLLKLQNGDLAELGEVTLPTGSYNQMRLVLAENSGSGPLANSVVLTSDNSVMPLTTPSGSQSGVKAKQFNIVIGPNQLANFVIDFDACKSVVVAGNSGKYLLKPQLTVIPRYISGVKGSVDPTLLAGSTSISLQQAGVVIKATTPDAVGNYLLPAAPGSYTLGMTAPGQTPAVVTGVTVAAETGTSVTPLIPTVSATGTLTGTAPVDTLVRVLQTVTLTGTPVTVEVAGQFVNAITGSYNYTNLPVAAPRIAPYVAGAPLAFTPDAAAAGKYTVNASLNGAVKTLPPVTLTSGVTTTATPITFP